ncbi:unnamed protein product [Rotaria sordida]|uniref:mitogen-activated protein kinase n=1 Tax=Rotaria sordida TaxID=392033 RepID=A0A814QLX7_9BILA|nr:unnamed protein product [Rotaria sordida]CAF3875065.1 unnamed protein product [Rotaria sordida]
MTAEDEDEVQTEWYTTLCGDCTYTLPVRYQELAPIGQGGYGAVIRAKDTKTDQLVAIKRLLRPFQTVIHAKRTYRELKLLIYLNHPDADVIQLYDVFTPEKKLNDFKTLYFVFNFVDYTLQNVIKSRLPLEENFIRQTICSILRGLKFIHSAGIIHRDLKPENIGIDKEGNVSILDFGLSRIASDNIQTGYVATRWWRAPEIIINWERYNEKLDIWSVGCMMAELILLRPIFRGKDHIDQLHKILDITGTPNIQTLNEICTQESRTYISRMTPKPKQDFNQLFGYKYDSTGNKRIAGVPPEGVDLLDRLLSFDHRLRPTAEQALAHQFLQQYQNPMEELTIEPLVDEHEDVQYTIEQWKSIVWRMIEDFVPPSWINNDHGDNS